MRATRDATRDMLLAAAGRGVRGVRDSVVSCLSIARVASVSHVRRCAVRRSARGSVPSQHRRRSLSTQEKQAARTCPPPAHASLSHGTCLPSHIRQLRRAVVEAQ